MVVDVKKRATTFDAPGTVLFVSGVLGLEKCLKTLGLEG